MGIRLPGVALYYLPQDDLAPECYECIMYPLFAWSAICEQYIFDDCPPPDFQIINMRERPRYINPNQPLPRGGREKARMKEMVYSGDIVMLEIEYHPGNPFRIDEQGALVFDGSRYDFKLDGVDNIIAEYGRSVRRRQRRDPNYRPRTTVRRQGYMGARSLGYAPLISPDERPQLTPAVLITRPGQPPLHHAEQVMFAVPSVPVAPPAAGTATGLPGRSSSDGDWYMGGEACEGTCEECAVRDAGVRDGTRGPGHVFNTDGTTDESQPNIGKHLSAEQQAELGGAGSGSPGGWEPQDEENARSKEGSHNNNFGRFKKDDLVSSANEPINDKGLSAAARAWEKHAGRPDGFFEPLKGNPTQKSKVANQFVNEVLNNKNTIKTELSKGGVEYRLPDGRGVRYNSDGSFSGFLDPKKPR